MENKELEKDKHTFLSKIGLEKKDFKLFLYLTLFFSVIIFFIFGYISDYEKKDVIEEEYMEKSNKFNSSTNTNDLKKKEVIIDNIEENIDLNIKSNTGMILDLENKKNEINKKIFEKYIRIQKKYLAKQKRLKKIKEKKIQEELKKRLKNVDFIYTPYGFKYTIDLFFVKVSKEILSSSFFYKKLSKIYINLVENKIDVRGKMKERTINIFGVNEFWVGEYISVFIHELGHYYDLYYLSKKVFKDPSYYFYDISWIKTKILKKGQTQNNFVSGYAMTNKYEDFAESFIYYVLHNKDFLEKSKSSIILKRKYDFFKKVFFKSNIFVGTDYSNGKVKNYYRDITKIKINYKNFLKYLKN